MIAHLQPYIHARCFPVVRFVENIKQAITVEVREPGFVKPDTTGKERLPEMAVAIPVEDPGFRIGIVWIKPALSPFGHLGSEDVEIAIAVDVGNLEAVAVDYVPAHQVMAYPRLGMLRFTFAFVPFQRRDLIPGVDHDLRILRAFDESAGCNAAADVGDLDGPKMAALVLKPVVASQQVNPTVYIDVDRGQSLGVFPRTLARASRIDFFQGPLLRLSWVRGNVGDEQLFRALVPEHELGPAGPFEVSEDLVMVLMGAALLDRVSFPRDLRVIVPGRIAVRNSFSMT